MEKNKILKKFFTQKAQDYTYAISFFLIFSFFIFFIIRPNLITVFESGSKIDNLKKIDNSYENQIQNIISIQSSLEDIRDELPLLDSAVAKMPQVNKVLADITNSINDNKLVLDKINIKEINLKDTTKGNQLKKVVFNLEFKGDFDSFKKFYNRLDNQRRLKNISSLTIGKNSLESSSSGNLIFNVEVESYYL